MSSVVTDLCLHPRQGLKPQWETVTTVSVLLLEVLLGAYWEGKALCGQVYFLL